MRTHESAVRYQRERLADLWAELAPLIEAHYREISVYPDIPLDPDKERYRQAEDAGMIHCYTARTAAGALIGYAWFVVNTNLHYRSSLQAMQDVIFIHPEHRRGRVGMGLIAHCDDSLRAAGVQVVYHHTKVHHDFGRLLERLGYSLNERVYARRLDR